MRARALLIAEDADPASFSEIRRVCSLAIVPPLSPDEHEQFCRENIDARQFEKGWRFFELQSAGMLAYRKYGGLFAPIGVGWGKTLLSLWIAAEAFRKGLQRTLLLVPPQVYPQLVRVDIPWARQRISLPMPFVLLGGKTAAERRSLVQHAKRGCFILPHSCLSTKDSVDLLKAIDPSLVIVDEAHNFKNRRAARTRRLVDFLTDRPLGAPRPGLVALSGTMTTKSVMDYFHLIKAALREGTPLPLTAQAAAEWGSVVDSAAEPTEFQFLPLTPLVDWARKNFSGVDIPFGVTGFRAAYRLRLTSAPGVVASGDSDIGVSLVMSNLAVQNYETHPEWPKLKELIDNVNNLYLTPNGDEIKHAIHTWRWHFELSAGFYNERVWPTVDALAKRRNCTIEAAGDMLDAGQAFHEADQKYSRVLRPFLQDYSKPGLDTPMLVAGDMAKHGGKNVPSDIYRAWKLCKEIEVGEARQGREVLERDKRAVRVCDYKVAHAIRWAQDPDFRPPDRGAILWYWNQELGQWLYEQAIAAGLDALHLDAGPVSDKLLLEDSTYEKVCICSIPAHGTGKNLQRFQHQIVVQFPRSAKDAEQMIGRTHRNGQEADNLDVWRCDTSEFDQMNFAACLNDALYIQQTTSSRQKIVYAGYDPLPKIFNVEVLRERGFQNEVLSHEQRAALVERFGATLTT
jgi:hypothetical protein